MGTFKKITIGNDFKLILSVYRLNSKAIISEGVPEGAEPIDLTDAQNISLVLYNSKGYTRVLEPTIDINILAVEIPMEQQEIGAFYVVLDFDKVDIEYSGGLRHYRADWNAFEIVAKTACADSIDDVSLVGVIYAGKDGTNGKSNYELAVYYNGFVGTEEEYLQSLKGEKGDKGEIGSQGIQGIQGIQGATGDKGDKGDTGATGTKGDKGDTGIQGLQGIKGDKGDTGAEGADGVQLGETSTTAYAGDKGKKNAEDLVQLGADLGDNIEPALAEILNHQNGRILALEDLVKNMLFKAGQFDTIDIVKQLNVWGGTNLVIVGTAAPTIVPDFIGQWYINTSGAGTTYQSKGIASTSDWKQTSN